MTAPASLTGTPEEIFERVYREHRTPICQYILDRVHNRALAEDLTQELFAQVWKYDVSRGKPLPETSDGRGALLAYRARCTIASHFRPRRSREIVVDFTDKEESVTRRLGAADGMGAPHLVLLYHELEEAKVALTAAARAYKGRKCAESYAERSVGKTRSREAANAATARLARRVRDRQLALQAFKAAADEVARIRAEWNRAAHDMNALAVAR